MVGVPGSGKSTWISQRSFSRQRTVITGTDNHVEAYAQRTGKTYTQAFKEFIDQAGPLMDTDIARAVSLDMDIVWDQTSLRRQGRIDKLAQIPDYYRKIAIVFPIPEPEELERRLTQRPGKTIPVDVVNRMRSSFEIPTLDEGWDEVRMQ
jgi:predicted kinase